jgi:hypothetical protein
MIGIILAAGKATRLPDKPLLPRPGGGLLIDYSFDLCQAALCEEIRIIVSPDSVLPFVLGDRPRTKYVVQEKPGVHGAIVSGMARGPADRYLVTFCDNAYDPVSESYTVRDCRPNCASTRLFKPGLDLTSREPDGFWARGGASSSTAYFAGWLLLRNGLIEQADTFEAWLNVNSIAPVFTPDNGWLDAGTLASYKELWTR